MMITVILSAETKTLIRQLEKILIKLYRQNVTLLSNHTWLNERLLPNYIYVLVYLSRKSGQTGISMIENI